MASWGRVFWAIAAVVLLSTTSSCGGVGDNADTGRFGESITKGSQASGMLVVSSQASDGKSVTVDKVTLPKAGYVAVYSDGAGAPGPRIGVSALLGAGTHDHVVVTLDGALSEKAIVHVMLHAEDNGNTRLDFPEHDAPLFEHGAIVEAAITIRVAK